MSHDVRDPEPFKPGPSLAPYCFTLDSYADHFGRRGVTRFQNPTKTVVKTDLHVGPTTPPGHRHPMPTVLRIIWEPGQTLEVPSEFARALRHREGGTITGHCPQLLNLSAPDAAQPVAPNRENARLVDD
jgi:hypothetical protein